MTTTSVDASHTPDQLLPESRDSEAGSTQVRAPSFFDVIQNWFQFIIRIPRMIIGLRMDHDALTTAFGTKVAQDIDLANTVRELARRLQYYEQNIPRMRELRQHYEQEQLGVRKSSNGSKLIALQ